MLVKPLTSLALCAFAVTVALPADAAPLEASGSTTLVVTGSTTLPERAPTPIVRVTTHRPRKSMKKKAVLVKAGLHHAEPAKTPVVAAVVTTPIAVTKVKASSKSDVHGAIHHGTIHTKGEILIGPSAAAAHVKRPAIEAKVVVAPAKPALVPAEIEVKTDVPAKAKANGKIEVNRVKATVGIRPVAQETVVEKEAPARVALDVSSAKPRVVLASGSGAEPIEAETRAKIVAKKPCLHEGIEFVRGQEAETFSVTRCDGSVAPLALEKLSILARPDSAPLPKSVDELAKVKGPNLAAGIRRIDPGLAVRIQTIADHFAKNGPAKVSIISGYRPMSSGSYHATAQAMDLRIEGVANEAVVEFCKSLVDTGCGYYPNSSFVHVDVRQPGTGHVAWIDASGPGEAPRYVASWPPPPSIDPELKSAQKLENPTDKQDTELPVLPSDDPPAAPSLSAVLPVPLELAK